MASTQPENSGSSFAFFALPSASLYNRMNIIEPFVRRPVATTLLSIAAALLAGCGSAYPRAPALAAGSDYRYVIGPGDTVNIVVFRNPELSMIVPVRPDGKIAAPLVEDLSVVGKDAAGLAREIEKSLSKFIRDPVVTVVVTGFVGPYSEQIRVVGEAAKPQVLLYKEKMTLLDVMIAVGGMTDFADGNGASILRTSEGNKQYSVRLRDLLKRADVSANVEMKPGDVVLIPQSWF
jgi:polysaccharide export outer membrane protein